MKKPLHILLLIVAFTGTVSAQQTVKYVDSEQAFLNALGSNTELIITTDTLDFTTESLEVVIGEKENKPDQPQPESYWINYNGLVLYGYSNLTIKGLSTVNIISKNAFDDILSFEHCNGLNIQNLAIYHTPETCNGSVLALHFCDDISVTNSSLNGSGGIGADLIGTTQANFTNTDLFNNVFHPVYAVNSTDILFNECNIYSNLDWGGHMVESELSKVQFVNCLIENNESELLHNTIDSWGALSFIPEFIDCTFTDNKFEYLKPNLKELEEQFGTCKKPVFKQEVKEHAITTFMEYLLRELSFYYGEENLELFSFLERRPQLLEQFKEAVNDAAYEFSDEYFVFRKPEDLLELENPPEISKLKKDNYLVEIYSQESSGKLKQQNWTITLNQDNKISNILFERINQ